MEPLFGKISGPQSVKCRIYERKRVGQPFRRQNEKAVAGISATALRLSNQTYFLKRLTIPSSVIPAPTKASEDGSGTGAA